eukprot:258144-Alexandrium_andersonii.AAC.1
MRSASSGVSEDAEVGRDVGLLFIAAGGDIAIILKPGQIGEGRWRSRDTTGLSASARRAPARECHVDTE